MKAGRFYEHFTTAYGTTWLVLLFLALITQSHIRTGAFGAWGFPLLSLAYAVMRARAEKPPHLSQDLEHRIRQLEEELAYLREQKGPR